MPVLVALALPGASAVAQPAAAPGTRTQVVLLGTGNPNPDPDRSGPATAIVVNGTPYLVDFGAGVMRRAKAAVVDKGIAALDPPNFRVVFVTHLHSDHTIGYADLVLTPWIYGRRVPLEVYGPPGIKAMIEHLLEAYRADFESRTREHNDGLYTVGSFPEGHGVNAHEIAPGVVYKDANVTVTAFPTRHALPSYGYRFDTPDRSIVISGDTNPTEATVEACRGCDILIHEVQSLDWLSRRPDFQSYAARYHTTTVQLAELASRAKPRLLILHHASIAWRPAVNPKASAPEVLLAEITFRPRSDRPGPGRLLRRLPEPSAGARTIVEGDPAMLAKLSQCFRCGSTEIEDRPVEEFVWHGGTSWHFAFVLPCFCMGSLGIIIESMNPGTRLTVLATLAWAMGAIALSWMRPVVAADTPQGPATAKEPPVKAQPDHLILGIRDLDEGIRLFHEQTGVRPTPGGTHPGAGTQNALVSLGPGLYVEVIAPAAGQPAGASERVASLRGLERLTPLGWAVSVAHVEEARQRLTAAGFEVSAANPGSRARPDGSLLRWETFGVTRPQIAGAPFFIRWGDGVTHPSKDSPGGCRLERLVLSSGSPDDLRRLLRSLDVDVTAERAAKGGMAFALQCPKGTVRFTSE